MNYYLFNENHKGTSEAKKPKKSWSSSKYILMLKIYGTSIIPGLLLFFPIILLIKFSLIKDEYLAYLFIFALIFFSGLSLFPLEKNWRTSSWRLTISTIVVLFSLFFFNGFDLLSKNIMRIYKFGAIENTSIGVDDIGCQIFKNKNPIIECNPKDKVFSIKNVNVLWRVGEYYVRFAGQNHNYEEVVLSSAHVYHLDPIRLNKSGKFKDAKEKLVS